MPPATGGKFDSRTQTQEQLRRTLTFAERAAYQYAIEEVYWRHRIWPRENPGPKPPLDAIVSQRQIEQKVEEYLRKSQLVADRRGWPITGSELQTEMERMANHTRTPKVLGELFEALGNDPFVIAECLARPILAERLVNECEGGSSPEASSGRDGKPNREAITNSGPSDPATIARAADPPHAAYKLPEIPSGDCVTDSWTATNFVDAPFARKWHTAVWTGTEMIIWGGDRNFQTTDTGGRYNPALDSWVNTAPMNAPSIRSGHTAVWTGIEMIVWGGGDNADLNSGGRYNPVTDIWVATSTTNAPLARVNHTAVWTGSEMIVWGGSGCGGNCNLNSGGRYDPGTDSWTPTSTVNVPSARWDHTAVWTGSEMIVWGGTDALANHLFLHTGGRYNPNTDSWTPTGLTNVPLGRIGHTAVWTGEEMIVWGGTDENFNVTNSGGRYNPINDGWVATSLGNVPSDRASHTAVWTGGEMIIWGGAGVNTGGRYNPATDGWTPTTTVNAPMGRASHTAVWIGREMIVWGGESGNGAVLNTGGSYCAQSGPTPTPTPGPTATPTPTATPSASPTPTPTATPANTSTPTSTPTATATPSPPCTGDIWTPTSTTLAPAPRDQHTVVWTGSEMVVWGGYNGSYLNNGGRYNPSTDTWRPISTVNAPDARAGHTAVWTGSEMVVWGGATFVGYEFDNGGRYNPTTDIWTGISIVNVPTNRDNHTAVWTGDEMIVWAGQGDGYFVRTGGRYNPGTNTEWIPTSITNAPSPRDAHTAVWTGSEMLVWGGVAFGPEVNTGGRYNPNTDSWVATNIVSAPTARALHTGVWTGSEMIVWGGQGNGLFVDTGGKYNPGTDTWTPTSITDAPSTRDAHTAVWTGSEMIVWGGYNGSYLNTGGRYNPGADSWTATSTTLAPAARSIHTAVWTGSQMIVWGGYDGSSYLNTGGRYCMAPSLTPTPTPTATPCAVFAYISDLGSGTVSVIDTCNNIVVAAVPLFGDGASGVAVNPAGTRVYVTNTDSNNVSVIDTSTNTVVALVPVGARPLGVAINPDGTRVYVANSGSQPMHTVSVIDTSTNTVVATVELQWHEPYGVTVKPDGTRVYVTNAGFTTVSVIDTSTNTEIATVPVGSQPHGIAINPAGTRVYVTNNGNGVAVVDTSNNTVVATVPVGGGPEGVAVNPAGARVYVTNAGSNTVSVIDTSNNTIVATVPVGSAPKGVSVTPDGTLAYVANYGSNTVSVINTSSNTLVATITVATSPQAFGNFIATVPRPSPTPTPSPTPPPHPCQLRVLIVYSDTLAPAEFQWEIQNQPNVAAVDLFNARNGTPTLAQLQQYDIIVPCSFSAFQDAETLGNNLADYVDGGGVVVQYGFSHSGGALGINGRWVSGSYNPYYYSGKQLELDPFTLGTFNAAHPLMAGVTTLNSDFANIVAPVGSTEVAQMNSYLYNDASLIAVRQVSGGHTTVGVTGYVGDETFQSGDWGKVVVNAGNWLYNCQPGPIPTPSPGCNWRLVSPMPVDVYGAAGASDGSYFYAAGGYSWTQSPSTLAVLNRWSPDPPPNGSWVTLAPMPQPAAVAMGVYYPLANKIYVFGGLDPDSGDTYDITRIYDIASNTWSTGAPMPDVRNSSACGYSPATGRIYVISGSYKDQITANGQNTWAYDPVADSWTDLTASAPFPHPASGSAYGVINNKLYIAGGADAIDGNNLTWEYDPVTNTYTQKADEPSSFQNNVPGSAVANGRLWVFGGGNPFAGVGAANSAVLPTKPRSDAAQAAFRAAVAKGVKGQAVPDTADDGRYYDPVTDTWTSAPNLAVARSFPSSGAIGDSLLIAAGGYNGSTSVHTVQKAIPCFGAPTPTPSPPPSPTPTPTTTPTPTSTPTPTPTPTPGASPALLGNISTRLRVETGDNVLIGGFIVTGTQPKKIIVRAIGPSLSSFFPDALADPVLELRDSSGALIRSNDNWRSDQEAEIIATGLPPGNNLESAIVATLPANNSAYTAIMRGANGGTGIGLLEAYDLDRTVNSKLADISTRGFVQTGDNVLIGGLIVLGQNPLRIIVRAIGPSLSITAKLADPTLELRDANGALIRANDNWRSDQQAEIIATGIPPANDLESAIVQNLAPGSYTAIVRGVNGSTGIALVEVYALD